VGEIVVREAKLADIAGMAAVHVQSWKETYRGLAPAEMLDSPDLQERREHMWTRILSDPELHRKHAVAEHDGQIVGIALAGSPDDEDAPRAWKLYVLYVLAAHHGTGAGQQLLDAVVGSRPAYLWVADPNPRAQAFYRRNGFTPDGRTETRTVPGIRMVRD
jgi:GNAT superfamily N-acetyltransferase